MSHIKSSIDNIRKSLFYSSLSRERLLRLGLRKYIPDL